MHHIIFFPKIKHQNPFSHLDKYEIIIHNKFSCTVWFALHVLPPQTVFKKENSKKGFKKHGTSIIDIFVSLTPDISQYLKK